MVLQVEARPTGTDINMVYTDVGDPCDCMCTFDLAYTIGDVPSGSWRVTAGGGVSSTVTVP